MAEVHHIHHDTDASSAADTSIAMLVFTIIAILAVAAFAFFAFNGTFFRTAPAGDTVNVEGTIDVPSATPSTNQGGTMAP